MYDSQPTNTMVLRCLTLNHHNHLENVLSSPLQLTTEYGTHPGKDEGSEQGRSIISNVLFNLV